MTSDNGIRPKDRDAILQSLSAGVVPRRGIQHIQVGRAPEVSALLRDLDRVVDGGAAVRFVIGEYGSGKTFFLHLMRMAALEKNLVTMHADLNPDRRLHGSDGQARGLYAEMAHNMATRTSPEGGALGAVVERFVSSAVQEATRNGSSPDSVIRSRLDNLNEHVGGYDFAEVIAAYWTGHENGRADLKNSAVRWLRGEYSTKTEARQDLGVRTIVDDATIYDQIKLLARFVVLAGYKGLLVSLDELVNLYKLGNTKARTSNYEQILRIVNDCLQGTVDHLGFVFAGTPEFLTDTRRGLYSYEALQSRLAESTFTANGLRDYSGPVIRLASLTPEELFVLLTKLRSLFSPRADGSPVIGDDGIQGFMQHSSKSLGSNYFRTPRTSIRAFVQLASVLDQNPSATWQQVLNMVTLEPDSETANAAPVEAPDDQLATFRL
jgi:P-loop Domain of unknown function (DUF2791)